jgi:hypothetical protein
MPLAASIVGASMNLRCIALAATLIETTVLGSTAFAQEHPSISSVRPLRRSSWCEAGPLDRGLLAITDVAQLLGAGFVGWSLLVPADCMRMSTDLMVVPRQIGSGGYGFSLVGRF